MSAPSIKRLVDLVERGPEDDYFYPPSSSTTLFRKTWPRYHNVVTDITELSYQGHAAWGQRITIPISYKTSGDLLQWVCLRFSPRTWLPADVDARVRAGTWRNPWTWAKSLGIAAIQRVEFEMGDTLIESWPGEWIGIWSRLYLDASRSGTWDLDMLNSFPEDGFIYCWLPLFFARNPRAPLPLVAVGGDCLNQEMRLHITLRPFHEVITGPRDDPCQTPLGTRQLFWDVTGGTPIPWEVDIPSIIPEFHEMSVLAGVVQTENPLRATFMREPHERMIDPVVHMSFDVETSFVNLPLKGLNGPIQEIVWFLRRKDAALTSDWMPQMQPLFARGRLRVGTAIWREEDELWWRMENGMQHRGGVRAGCVYGFAFGTCEPQTINASEIEIRLELDGIVQPNIEVHVFGITTNWLRFVGGVAGLLFQD